MLDITAPQLSEFKKQIKDVQHPLHDDIELLKWLNARKGDVNKAEVMYRKSMRWRADNNIDSILEEFKVPEVLQKYYATGQCGKDKYGHPLYIDTNGRLDVKGIMHSVQRREIIKFMIYKLEVMQAEFRHSRNTESRVDQAVKIIDCEELGANMFWKPALDLYREILSVLSNNYPESLGKSYIVNISKIVTIAYNMLKRFIDKGTTDKFEFLSGSQWKTTLLEHFNAEDLPAHYGGSKTDPDGNPKCLAQICYGGLVPESYYRDKDESMFNEKTTKECTIRNRAKIHQEYQLAKGQCLSYAFKTQHYIMFGISYKVDDSEEELLYEQSMQTNSDIVPYVGEIIAEEKSTYIFEFSNENSIFTQCWLKYDIGITEPPTCTNVPNELQTAPL